MGDRIVVMNEGVVQQIGAPRTIFDRPANRFVAGFVGEPSVNLTDCTLDDAGGSATLRFGRQLLALERGWLDSAGLGKEPARALSLGIRPQHLTVASRAGEGAPNVISGVVYAAETLGSETILDVETDGVIFRAWVKNSALGRISTAIGEPIGLQVDPRAIYLFDRDSGSTLAYADLSRLDDEHAALVMPLDAAPNTQAALGHRHPQRRGQVAPTSGGRYRVAVCRLSRLLPASGLAATGLAALPAAASPDQVRLTLLRTHAP